MAEFYRKEGEKTIYTGYDPQTGQFGGGISSEAQAQQLGVIPDWEASWKPPGATTNIQTISSENLKQTKPIDLTGSTPFDDDQASPLIAGATAYAEQIRQFNEAAKTEEERQAEAQKSDILAQITSGLTSLEGLGLEQLTKEKEAGIPAMSAQLADIEGQIGVGLAEFQQYQTQWENYAKQLGEEKGMLMPHLVGLRGRVQEKITLQKNVVAAEIGILQAQGLAIQGKLTAAQNTVNRAIDLKYSAEKQKLETLKFQLTLIEDDLNEEQQIRADALRRYYSDLDRAIEDQKATEKEVQSYIIAGIEAGVPQNIIDQASKETSTIGAATILAPAIREIQQREEAAAAAKKISNDIAPSTGNTFIDTTTNEQIDISTTAGLKRLKELHPDWTYGDFYALLDEKTKLTPGSIKHLLSGAEITDSTPVPAPQTNFVEVVGHIMNTMTDEERNRIYAKAKAEGMTKLFRNKWNDVQAYIESFKSRIEEAIISGYSKDEIKQVLLAAIII